MAKIDRETLVALRERLVKAPEPSRRLDYELFCHFAESGQPHAWDPDVGHEYTSSVDRALELAKRVLPGQAAGFQPCIGGTYRGHIIAVTDTSANLVAAAKGATPPLAICIALIDALTSESSHVE